jgi:hypothetical protein
MKTIVIAAIVLFGFNLTIVAQKSVSIKGKIVESASENPLKGVSVTIKNTNPAVETNGEGVFIIENISKGEYILQIFLEGFQPQNIPITISESKVYELGIIYLNVAFSEFIDQSIITLSDDDLSDNGDRNPAYVSGVFQSSKDVYLKAAAYNFSQAWYKVRGYDSSYGTILINGVEMNKLYDGRPQWSNWGGLNDAFRNQEFTTGIAPASYTFGSLLGTTNFSLRASNHQDGIKVSLSSTNKSYAGRVMATYATGLTNNNWAFVASASRRIAQEGYFEGTTYNAWSGFLAVEKRFNFHHSINISAFVASVKRGKSSPNTQEVYNLKGYKYNSYWGEQVGDKRNARIKEIVEPVIMLSHYFDVGKTSVITTIAYQFGHISNSRLGYFNAPNPDPTYYKYLPSYYLRFNDNLDNSNAYLTEQNFINNGQINWQNLYQVNTDYGNSRYYLYEDRVDDSQFSLNSILNSNINDNLNLNAGISFQQLSSENYGNMLDLLGGNGFVDLDQYGSGDGLQNDLNNPNRTVGIGDKFQYNYIINAAVFGAFAQIQSVSKKIDYFVAISFKNSGYQRNGLYKNGTYPENSFGKGEKLSFTDFSAKAGATYKFTGRHLISLNAGYLSIAPTIRNSFANARVNNNIIPNLTSENIITSDLTYLYRSPKFQGRVTGFYTKFSNVIETSFFFAEGLRGDKADFVNEIITGVDKLNMGVELSAMYQIIPSVSILAGGSFGQFTYNNNPNLYLQSESFNAVESDFGTSYLKNYRVSGSPQSAFSIGFEYRDPKYWWFQINANLLTHNYLDISPLLRTNNFYLDADGVPFVDDETGVQVTQEQVNDLLIQERFDDAFLVNIVGGKSWFMNQKYVGFFIGINNVFGEVFKTGGFEQSRNANYPELKQDKQLTKPIFGPKYWYGNNTSYYLNLYFKF